MLDYQSNSTYYPVPAPATYVHDEPVSEFYPTVYVHQTTHQMLNGEFYGIIEYTSDGSTDGSEDWMDENNPLGGLTPDTLRDVYHRRRNFLVYSVIGDQVPWAASAEVRASFWQAQPRLHGAFRRLRPALALASQVLGFTVTLGGETCVTDDDGYITVFIKDVAEDRIISTQDWVHIAKASLNSQDPYFSYNNLDLDLGLEPGMDPALLYPVTPSELSTSNIIGTTYSLNAFVTDYPNREYSFVWETINFNMMVFLVVTIDDPLSADAEVGVVGMYFCADLAAMVASIRLEANIDHNQGNRHGHEPPFQPELHSWDDPNLPPNQPVNVMTVLFIIQAPLWLVQLR